MIENKDVIVVFTARSPERIVREGGSQAWVLNPARAKQCSWVVCTQNRHNPDHEFSDATEPHGTAFLLGKISSITRAQEEGSEGRWMIAISEYARVNCPGAWDHGRNPVRYTTLSELGINLEEIELQPMLPIDEVRMQSKSRASNSPPTMLTIAEAKKALAATFGVKPEAVEITIRG